MRRRQARKILRQIHEAGRRVYSKATEAEALRFRARCIRRRTRACKASPARLVRAIMPGQVRLEVTLEVRP